VTPTVAPPQVLDAISSGDRAWAYVDGRQLREVLLPDLLRAASSQRADLEVGLATMAATCGFQPLLSVDELFARIRWEAREPTPPWGAVLRMQQPLEPTLRCLRALEPDAQETSLDGRPAWQLRRAVVAWNDGVFVVASSALEAHALMDRIAHPDKMAANARSTLAGVLLATNVMEPNPLGMETFAVRWTPRPPGSRMELRSTFLREMSARQAETIFQDGLLALIGPNSPLHPAAQSLAESFVHGATVRRNSAKLEADLDVPPLAGQTEIVSKLTALAVHGVRLYTSWDLAAEARDTVFVIARALVDYANRRREQGRPARFPPSAPLVPEQIPEGKRAVPNPHAFSHPSWQDIRFSSNQPTFYAVEFLTAKDGKSAIVRARGDIDGDGITSLFELDVRLDAHGVPVLAPMIRERDPEE
jgi:hypothetical protein